MDEAIDELDSERTGCWLSVSSGARMPLRASRSEAERGRTATAATAAASEAASEWQLRRMVVARSNIMLRSCVRLSVCVRWCAIGQTGRVHWVSEWTGANQSAATVHPVRSDRSHRAERRG